MYVRALILALVFSFGGLLGTGIASADKVSKKFGGQILTSDKKFPNSAKSPGAYISKLQKLKKNKFWENKETKEWKIYIAAFFKKPLSDLEYTIKFVDDRGTLLGTPFEQYTDSGGQTSVLSTVILDRKTFGVNKRVSIRIESGGRVVATGKFQILGEAEHYSGKVDFSEDEEGEKKE
jgi:hypothetical protein